MTRMDPFVGYSLILRTILFVLVPAFLVLQSVRLRRALHVLQLEGYKRGRFLMWCRANPGRALFLRTRAAKKPLVMTGRAWRILIAAVALSAAGVLVPSAAAHLLLGGAPADLITWVSATILVFFFTPLMLVAADGLLSPVQWAVNARYRAQALDRLESVDPVVIGVTGSFGKTGTKFAVATLLGGEASALATPASFNTPLGICRTINESLRPDHHYFVVEMGAYGVGEIAELCRFVHPSVGVLTAIGPAHLERFGSLEAIERAKYELIEALPADGTAVMNVDDERVRRLADGTRHVPVVRFGMDAVGAPDVTARNVSVSGEGTSFTITDTRTGRGCEVRTRLLGRFAVLQVLAGTAVAIALGRDIETIGSRVELLEPVEHRLQLVGTSTGVVVIDDSFNSNPSGADAALDVLEQMPGSRKVVVTPGMIELGDIQAAENERFAGRAAQVADVIIAVAPTNREALLRGAAKGDPSVEVVAVDNLAVATERLRTMLRPGDIVLFENDLPDQYER